MFYLHAGGKVIGTTLDHPFGTSERHWTPVAELRIGDHIRGMDAEALTEVQGVADSGRYDDVYNLHVADCHSYFVGNEDWTFSLWAHNAAFYPVANNKRAREGYDAIFSKKKGATTSASTTNPNAARPYEVGTAYQLRKTPVRDTQVHHVPQSRQSESLVGDFNSRNKVGNEPAIRLPISEHEAVSVAQAARTVPASARDLLASEDPVTVYATLDSHSFFAEMFLFAVLASRFPDFSCFAGAGRYYQEKDACFRSS